MNRFTHHYLILLVIVFFIFKPVVSISQDDIATGQDTLQLDNYREQIKRLVGFLEFSLNTLGDPETTTKEKEVIINESYGKAFLHQKVQIEDDLDENREILTYKDVQAYLKDVDFFFRTVEFDFTIQDIQTLTSTDGMLYFKVTANRNLKGVTVDNENVNNNKTRYIEINLDDDEQVLKIASIYTTRLNEAEELMVWWNNMPAAWKAVLGDDYLIRDSIPLSQIDFLNDTTFLLVHYVPELNDVETYIYIGSDSLLIIEKDTVMRKVHDNIPVGKNNALRALREIVQTESLDVSGNREITDLYPADQMSELKSLSIAKTPVSDLFPARNLTRLLRLNISGTLIEDLSPIQYNTQIRELYIDSTWVNSLEPIRNFSALEILHFSGSPVSDLSPVRGLANLHDLRLDNTPVSDLSPVSDIVNLENISFYGTNVTELSALQNMLPLKRINFGNTMIHDVTPLSKLENLQLIYADQSRIGNLMPLGSMPLLEKIYCDRTGVTRSHANAFMQSHPRVLVIYESQGLADWWTGLDEEWRQFFREYMELDLIPTKEQLHKIALISKIDLAGNKSINSLSPLSILTNLTEIYAGNSQINDLSPLSELIDLKILSIPETQVTDLTPLQMLVHLRELDLTSSAVSSLTGLHGVKSLQILKIDNTQVGDLEPLMDKSAIRFIYADDTRIGTADIHRFLDAHPGCLIIYQTQELQQWWAGLSSAWKNSFGGHVVIIGQPTREQLQSIADLKSLDISENRDLGTLDPLQTLVRIEELNAFNGTINDITVLGSLTRLKRLNLSGNPLSSLSPLSQLPDLLQLDISNTPVGRLDALKYMVSLEQLNCSGTQVKKLNPLSNLLQLRKLECYNTGLSNLKPLLGLARLRNLVCYNTRLSKKKVDAFKAMMPGVEVVFY
ncbi:MAG: leucine-rich repeat domain-containing protein [Bacteroidales bacterium]|nr:leucine-rich repeat domain-containing protein [Bacteroidales bacterium]